MKPDRMNRRKALQYLAAVSAPGPLLVQGAQLWQRGAEIHYLRGKALAQMVSADSQRWAVIAKATGARAD